MMKIIIADNHTLYREVVKLWLESELLGKVIAEASNGTELIEMVKTRDADLVIMDIEMPDINGIQATKMAISLQPNLKILVLVRQNDKSKNLETVKAGAYGILMKTADKTEFEEAINSIEKGQKHYKNYLHKVY